MAIETEELQAKEFLKRAEIRTMRKDLLKLREADSLQERDKIARIKTLEEQLEEKTKANAAAEAKAMADEKVGREEVLQKNEGQERIAEKDLKNYATEQERQQIFLLESQRLGFEKQVDEIDKERDPALKLEKNQLLIQKRDQQVKLNSILEQQKKLEDEQKFIIEKSQASTVPSERKGLEQSRWDLDKKIQDIEKNRWGFEKQIQEIDAKTNQIDLSSEQLVLEKNGLRDKILGVDKSLREIYSVVMAREEEKRRGQAEEQVTQKEALSKLRTEQKEKIQREQRSPTSKKQAEISDLLSKVPQPVREKIIKSSEIEEEQRKKFMEDVDTWSKNEEQQKSAIPANSGTIPPVPHRNSDNS